MVVSFPLSADTVLYLRIEYVYITADDVSSNATISQLESAGLSIPILNSHTRRLRDDVKGFVIKYRSDHRVKFLTFSPRKQGQNGHVNSEVVHYR
jgi:hypothetical protein